jgi:membrane protease YdiL (CAAX protease family)
MASPAAHGEVRWREVALFSLIAYALTWGWNAIWIIPNLGLLTASTAPADPTTIYGNLLNFLPGMFGPLVAAVVMRLWISREGLRGSLGLRRPWRQYAIALVAPIAFVVVVAAAIVLTGLGHLKPPAEPLTIAVVPLLALLLVLETVLGFGEEYGWRGYLLPKLMPLGEIPATLVLGLIWWPWHLPVLITGVILGGNSLSLVAPIHLCLVVLGTFPYTWLAKASGFSPALAAVFHGGSNWAGQRLLTFLVLSSALVGVMALGIGWLIVVLAWYGFRWFRARGGGRA